ncbi:MAG: hypothetical protein HQ596_03660 [Candidatus Saganbacteria bacterium]|nr:hypothetical protein [Candidatus Saganbacteria bacterium]
MSNVKCQMNVFAFGRLLFKIIIPSFVIFNLSFVIFPVTAFAQQPQPLFPPQGIAINDTPGNAVQQNPQIVADGKGNYMIVFEDGRGGSYDIYAQKMTGAGAILWKENGVALCKYSGNQNFPKATTDSKDGMIVVWQDYRSGHSDIYAQRIGPAGNPLWGTAGIPVCTAKVGQFAPELISDGSGGAIIVWHDYRSGKGEDIYAQKINSQGNSLWQENGIPICSTSGTQWYPKIASDGTGGAIITWTDGRGSSSDNNIYAQRINSSGKYLWEKDGIPVCAALNNQERPEITQASDGAIIAWNDSRSNNIDIYAQKVDLSGKLLWQKNGVAACSLPYAQENPRLSPDGQDGAILVWTDFRSDESDIYAQRITKEGRIAWSENGRAITNASGGQKNPAIVKLTTENWVIAWEDKGKQNAIDLLAQKINSAGTLLWQSGGITVASGHENQESPALAAGLQNNAIICWQDTQSGGYDIYAQNLGPDGNLLFAQPGLVVCAAQGSVIQQNMELTLTNQNEIILAFEDARSGYFNVYLQKVNKNGKLMWGLHGIPIAKVSANELSPCIISDSRSGGWVAWEDYRAKDFPAIRLQHINSSGQKLLDSSLPIAKIKSRQTKPLMIRDGAGGAIVTWQDDRDVLSLKDIYAQRISQNGELLWGSKGKIVISANGDQIDQAMIPDGMGGALLAWTDYRRGDRNPNIYAQRINSSGEPLWQKDGVLVCGAPDVQRSPKLIGDGEGGAIISWTDKGGGSYDIYAQRIDKSGRPLWMTDGIPINQLSRTQQNARFSDKKILVWEDYRYGNWDIFATEVTPFGKLPWGEQGVAVVSMPYTQYSPQIIPWKNGSVIIAWEDYRSGEFYEIYMQKLNSNGKADWMENGIKIKSRDGARSPKIVASPEDNSLYIFWEDYANGGRAIYGQRYRLNQDVY